MTSLPRKPALARCYTQPSRFQRLTFGATDAVDAETPLKPAELGVLRAQYEKEGEMVGVQTKFNYAWV